jgi:hypothetical protein
MRLHGSLRPSGLHESGGTQFPATAAPFRPILVSAALMERSSSIGCKTLAVRPVGIHVAGILGPFETWKVGIPYPYLTGDIASTAALTVHEPDDGIVQFARWRALDQNAVSRSAVPAPAREEDAAARHTG